jgi:protein TonB
MKRMSFLRVVVIASVVSTVLVGGGLAQTSAPTETRNGASGGPYRVGGDVTAPKVLKHVEAEFSDEARRKKVQGTMLLSVVVGADGNPHDIRVVSGLGHGLDENAIKALKQWRFEPASKDGQPVPTIIRVEVTFHLLTRPSDLR